MNRNVYLQGELGEKFGKKFSVNTDNYADIIKCINVNRPGFLNFIRQCHFDGISIACQAQVPRTLLVSQISEPYRCLL